MPHGQRYPHPIDVLVQRRAREIAMTYQTELVLGWAFEHFKRHGDDVRPLEIENARKRAASLVSELGPEFLSEASDELRDAGRDLFGDSDANEAEV